MNRNIEAHEAERGPCVVAEAWMLSEKADAHADFNLHVDAIRAHEEIVASAARTRMPQNEVMRHYVRIRKHEKMAFLLSLEHTNPGVLAPRPKRTKIGLLASRMDFERISKDL